MRKTLLSTGPCTRLHGIRANKVRGRASGFSPLATSNEPDAVTMRGQQAVNSNRKIGLPHPQIQNRRSIMQKTYKKYFCIFVLPTLIAFTLFFVIPFVLGIGLSFCKFTTVTNARWVGLENYLKAFSNKDMKISGATRIGFSLGMSIWNCKSTLDDNLIFISAT